MRLVRGAETENARTSRVHRFAGEKKKEKKRLDVISSRLFAMCAINPHLNEFTAFDIRCETSAL